MDSAKRRVAHKIGFGWKFWFNFRLPCLLGFGPCQACWTDSSLNESLKVVCSKLGADSSLPLQQHPGAASTPAERHYRDKYNIYMLLSWILTHTWYVPVHKIVGQRIAKFRTNSEVVPVFAYFVFLELFHKKVTLLFYCCKAAIRRLVFHPPYYRHHPRLSERVLFTARQCTFCNVMKILKLIRDE